MGLFKIKKNKEVMVVFGSPNQQGHTGTILSEFLRDFEAAEDWHLTQFSAYDLNAHPCTGCKACAKKGQCVFKDLEDFDKKLRQCDLLVWASPIYNSSFPAPMKAILDRTQRYFESRFSLNIKLPIKKHRKAVLLLSMGSDDAFGIDVAHYQLKRAFSVMNTELVGCAVWRATDLGVKNRAEALVEAHKLARVILDEPEGKKKEESQGE